MATPAELALAEQLTNLRTTATARDWPFHLVGDVQFTIVLPARDGSTFRLLVECDHFLDQPPAFHWYNADTGARDQPADTPTGGQFFHNSGRICAPWNRLAYKQYDPKGPHGDWSLADWMTNPKTGSTKTLCAMALRIYTELQKPTYKGRMA